MAQHLQPSPGRNGQLLVLWPQSADQRANHLWLTRSAAATEEERVVQMAYESTHSPRLPYLPGLDGLRALAVIAVLLYHLETTISGGFLGVEAFFVLSGFLITALLIREWQQKGRIDLPAFWARRALRLFPALLLVLASTVTATAVLLPDELATLRGDVAAALVYLTNWQLIGSGQSYFDAFERPPLLQHLWSLAVEEQFYLFWPLVLIIGLRYLKLGGMLIFTLGLAGASAALMMLIYQPGVDPSRMYYGTDTRAAAPLLGAALGLVWQPERLPGRSNRHVGVTLDILGSLGLLILVISCVRTTDQDPVLYRGGLQGMALLTVLVIMATTHPQARVLPALLGIAPLRWIGQRSYGIYLWHWPIFMLTRPGIDVEAVGWPVQVVRVGSVVLIAALAYWLVEQPIRHGALQRNWQAWRLRHMTRTPRYAPVFASTLQFTTVSFGSTPVLPGRSGPGAWRNIRRNLRSPLLIIGMMVFGVMCAAPPAATTQPSPVAPAAPSRTISAAPTAAIAANPRAEPAAEATLPLPTAAPAPTMPMVPTAAPARDPATAAPTSSPTAETRPALQRFDPALAAELQRILDANVASGAIPGSVLAVSIPGHELWTGASGLADRKQKLAMTPETHVRIASISKMFTAVVILQLAEEGKLDLDSTLASYFPGIVPSADRITIRQLLQHRTGLYDYLEDRNYVNRAYREPARVWKPEELVAYAAQFPALFAPGSKNNWDYSSTNFVLLGMIAEKVVGRSLAAEMRARIFEPAAMESTFFAPDEPVDQPYARGYSKTIDQTNVALSFAFATANLVSTVADEQRFAAALFGGKLLKPETLSAMTTFTSGKGQYNMPDLAYGLGIMRNRLAVGVAASGTARPASASTVYGHIGGFGGFRSALWYAPASGITITLGENQASTDPNILATKVWDAILRAQGQ